MDLVFSSSEMASACNSRSGLDRVFGAGAEAVAQRLAELHAIECLADAAELPQVQIGRDGAHVVIGVDGLLRLRAQPGPGNAPPTRARWTKITQLTDIEIETFDA